MRLHVVGLANARIEPSWSTCAYSTKTWRFCKMMSDEGHDVFLYAGPSDDPPPGCTYTQVLPEALRVEFFGEAGEGDWSLTNVGWQIFNQNTIEGIARNKERGDLLLVIGGTMHQPIAQAHPDLPCVEFGVGYAGVFTNYRVWESYAWMHTVYGELMTAYQADGRAYDIVIPNFFDPNDFNFTRGNGDYLLYLGRLIDRKGVRVAQEVARETDLPLILAGAGDAEIFYGEPIGIVGPVERAELLAGARALLAPTQYVEPFGGVVVEAHLAGTPTITTDWGAFTETVQNGINGYRCRIFDDFLRAVVLAPSLDSAAISASAQRFTIGAVAPLYTDFLDRVQGLYEGRDWYTYRSKELII